MQWLCRQYVCYGDISNVVTSSLEGQGCSEHIGSQIDLLWYAAAHVYIYSGLFEDNHNLLSDLILILIHPAQG